MSFLIKIKRKLYKLTHPIQGEIWCLHRVVHNRSIYPANRDLEITSDYLEHLIQRYREKGYNFVSIDCLVRSKCILPRKLVNISFDDGFADVYENAFPVFKRYNIPFTIYLTTGFPDYKADLWWLQMEHLGFTPAEFESINKEIYASDKPMAGVMHQLTSTSMDSDLVRRYTLSWEQLIEMVDSGLCTIGSHTCSHPGLTRISSNEVLRELIESKHIIETRLHIKVRHFSYPHSMQNETILRLVKQAGYQTATLGYGGAIRKGDNPYSLNRVYIVQP